MSLTGIIRNAFIPRQHKLERHFTEPEALQHDVLQHLLHTAAGTEYGRNHLFGNTRSYDDFVRNVPVNTYEELKGDIDRLRARGVQVRVDDAPSHMHHKFALFDGRVLANGSFNWTRSATRDNDENLVVSDDANLVRVFGLQFGKLWQQFG